MMIARLTLPVTASFLERARQLLPVVATLALFALLVAAIASTYVGHARSPYDTCFGANGRAIACGVLEGER